jgi:hypothetical protein
MTRKLIAATAIALPLIAGGCMQHHWAPGPEATKSFGVASGQCKLVALSGGSYTAASGSPQFVGTAMGAAAIGGAIRQQNTYNACMEAQGFVEADQQQAQPAEAQTVHATAVSVETDETIIAKAQRTCAAMDPSLGDFYKKCVAERSPRGYGGGLSAAPPRGQLAALRWQSAKKGQATSSACFRGRPAPRRRSP